MPKNGTDRPESDDPAPQLRTDQADPEQLVPPEAVADPGRPAAPGPDTPDDQNATSTTPAPSSEAATSEAATSEASRPGTSTSGAGLAAGRTSSAPVTTGSDPDPETTAGPATRLPPATADAAPPAAGGAAADPPADTHAGETVASEPTRGRTGPVTPGQAGTDLGDAASADPDPTPDDSLDTGRHAVPTSGRHALSGTGPEATRPSGRAAVRQPGAHPGVPRVLRVTSEICARMLIIATALAVVVLVLIQLRVVVIPVAISLLICALLAPVVDAAVHTLKLPRGLSAGVVLIGGMALFAAVLSFVINAFIAGLPDLVVRLTQSYEITIKPLLAGPPLHFPLERLNNLPGELEQSLRTNAQAITTGALTTAATLTEVLSSALLGLFVTIFFLYDGSRVWRFVLRTVPLAQRDRADIAGRRGFASLVGYTRATAVVAVVDALGIGIGLWIIGVPLVVPLAALVFLGAFVPVVGAVLSGSVSIAVALVANGPVPALIVLGVVIAVMQLESHVLQPILLGRAVQLHPLAVVLSVAGGVVVGGIVGALLAVPLVAVGTAAIRSLLARDEPRAEAIDPLDPHFARAAPAEPRARRKLLRLAGTISKRLNK